MGSLPFMALDMLSGVGLRGEIPRRYRHDAESFAWCLIYLYLATAKDEEGNNYTRASNSLRRWFGDPETSRIVKYALGWRDDDVVEIPLAHPNARWLACALHEYLLDRYKRQFQHPPWKNPPPYEEEDDRTVFLDMMCLHGQELGSVELKEIKDTLWKLYEVYKTWSE